MNIGEFQLIEKIGRLFPELDTTDDTAFIPLPTGGYQLLSCDQFTEGIHFLKEWAEPRYIGYRAVAAAVSDIFASGGIPHLMLTAIAIPGDITHEYVVNVYEGIAEFSKDYNVELAGGNVTKSPKGFSITTSVTGYATKPLRRSAAMAGDIVAITGKIGNTAIFLKNMFNGTTPNKGIVERWQKPRLKEIPNTDFVHAACDITDGLAQDLGHILDASDIGCHIELERIPLTLQAAAFTTRNPDELPAIALKSGEEYCNIITYSPEYSALFKDKAYPIGEIVKGERILTQDQKRIPWPKGFDHLGEK